MSTLQHVAASRRRVTGLLTGTMMILYFGFILLVAFDKPLMGSQLVPGLSVGILLGGLVILSAWILVVVYVLWANRSYDRQIAVLRERS